MLEPARLPPAVLDPKLADAGAVRGPGGRFVAGVTTSAQITGARSRKNRLRLLEALRLEDLADDDTFRPHIRDAESIARDMLADLAGRIGGGIVGPDVICIVRHAAMQTAVSMFFFAEGIRSRDPDLLMKASKLGTDARQQLLAAHELTARAAKARPLAPPPLWATQGPEDDADDADEPEPPTAPAEGQHEDTVP